MSYRLAIRDPARYDLREAMYWYADKRAELAADFLLCVDEVLARLTRNPLAYPIIYKSVRRAVIHRFPYNVLFMVREKDVAVIAILHNKRSPRVWQSRV